jgi:hypothetical protein
MIVPIVAPIHFHQKGNSRSLTNGLGADLRSETGGCYENNSRVQSRGHLDRQIHPAGFLKYIEELHDSPGVPNLIELYR